jgi:hypothetical protein
MRVYWARVTAGDPKPSVHSELRWVDGNELLGVDWVSPGDREVIETIRQRLAP